MLGTIHKDWEKDNTSKKEKIFLDRQFDEDCLYLFTRKSNRRKVITWKKTLTKTLT
jgi:hypothetical protein